MTTTDRDRAHVLWRQADELKKKAKWLRDDADAIDRAAERLSRMAAAVADGREQDILEAALSIGGSS